MMGRRAGRNRRRGSYGFRLQMAFAALAGLALLMAVLGWHILREAEHRVLRGRIASDIYATLLMFAEDKTELRNWSYRRILGQPAPPETREALIGRLEAHLRDYSALVLEARAADALRGKPPAEAAARDRTRALLAVALDRLNAETGALLPARPRAKGVAIQRIDRQFDGRFGDMADADLPALLAQSLAAERAALDMDRLRADEGLAGARRLFLIAAGSGVAGSLALALWLVARLRGPLRRIEEGLGAYARGDFSHRFDGFRDREFIRLGRQLNVMAAEVTQNRQREARFRGQLEEAVEARTGELRHALDELAASEQARQQLVADIGHELRTPVTVIRGEAQVALRAPDAESPRAALTRIVAVTRQMGRLIEDLLTFVRDPRGPLSVDPQPVRLAPLLSRAVEGARGQGLPRQVTVALKPLPEGCTVLADPDRLQQIVAALLDNAVRYSHPGGEVTVAVRQGPAALTLHVCDRGIGIAPGDLARAFTRGWRGDAARRHRPDGLGLGLAIAQDLAQAQGGRLVLHANAPQGVEAVLTLPRPPQIGG
ncbi:sensor histidine kinase [Paracoccus sp. NSM]|uniref:sensor histidine kinase n=1 Tax=Paracoccus sp. NSM TaxID=3457784 RepID=UPI00403701CF